VSRSFATPRAVAASAVAVALSLSLARLSASADTSRPSVPPVVQRVHTVSRLPVRFDPATNAGEEFIARGPRYAVRLSSTAITIGLRSAQTASRFDTVSMRLNKARTVVGRGIEPLPGLTNYISGNDRSQWRAGVRSFAKVEFPNVYDGVNVVYYGTNRQLEYDFAVKPGANPEVITLGFEGVRRIRVDAGALVLETPSGDLRQPRPVAYQLIDGVRRPVDVSFVVKRRDVSFRVGGYDHRHALVIDPVLAYSSYFGGSADDSVAGLATDTDGNIFLAGQTASLDFPHTTGSKAGDVDAFILKMNPAGDQLIYATFIGGTRSDGAKDVAVDAAGCAYVVGTTASVDFPAVNAIRSSPDTSGRGDGFLAKFDATGAIVYSTFIGGNGSDSVNGVAVDAIGRVFLVGQTNSSDLPALVSGSPGSGVILKSVDGGRTWASLRGLQSNYASAIAPDPANPNVLYAGIDHAFAVSVDAGATWTSTALPYELLSVTRDPVMPSTAYLGLEPLLVRTADGGATFTSGGLSRMVTALSINPQSPNARVAATAFDGVWTSMDGGLNWANTLAGTIWSVSRSLSSPSVLYAGTHAGVYKSTNDGMTWTAVYGGSSSHADPGFRARVNGVAVDPTDASIVYAASDIGLFKTTTGGNQWTNILPAALWTVAVSPVEPNRVYCASQFGGIAGSDDGGATWSITNTDTQVWTVITDPVSAKTAYAGTFRSTDAFIMRINADGSSVDYSMLLGGANLDAAVSIAIDGAGNAFVAGTTQSSDFPVANALQAQFGGGRDAFVAKITPDGALAYSTFLGGSGLEDHAVVAVDAFGRAHLAGYTSSSDLPLVRAQQPAFTGPTDAFVAALTPAGDALSYSTYLGRGGFPGTISIASTASGDVYVTGATSASDFPVVRAIQPNFAGGSDAFVTKVSAEGLTQWSTFLGGAAADSGTRIAIDRDDNVLVAGMTASANFPIASGFQSGKNGSTDAFLARIAEDVPDATAPTTWFAFTGLEGNAGWYRSLVSVSLSAADAPGEGGVAFIDYQTNGHGFQRYRSSFAIGAEGVSTIDARATDDSGHVEMPPASAVVRIDTTLPALVLAAPTEREYLHTESLPVQFSASDSGSGLAAGSPSATLDGAPVANGQATAPLTLSLGAHMVTASAVDTAGNASHQDVVFHVVATIGSLATAVDFYASQGRIDATTSNSLRAKLSEAQSALDRGNLTVVHNKLEDFIDVCTKKLSADVASVLIADARYVLGAL